MLPLTQVTALPAVRGDGQQDLWTVTRMLKVTDPATVAMYSMQGDSWAIEVQGNPKCSPQGCRTPWEMGLGAVGSGKHPQGCHFLEAPCLRKVVLSPLPPSLPVEPCLPRPAYSESPRLQPPLQINCLLTHSDTLFPISESQIKSACLKP